MNAALAAVPTMGNHSTDVTWNYVVPPLNVVRVHIMQRQDGPFRSDVIGGRGNYHVSLQQLNRITSQWQHVNGSTHLVALPSFQRAWEVAQVMWTRELGEHT